MNRAFIIIFCLLTVAVNALSAAAPPVPEVVISVSDQRLALLYDGGVVSKYRISTSRFGLGDWFYSYRTPSGRLRVSQKIGDSLPPGTVIKNRSATGEVLKANAPGRDPIVTRILWLDGQEPQNRNAHARGIYIHGTPQEITLGEPKSWGCIRMSSKDVVDLFDKVPVGTTVTILPGHLPGLAKYKPQQAEQIAVNTPPGAAPVAATQKVPAQISNHTTATEPQKKGSQPAVAASAVKTGAGHDLFAMASAQAIHALKGSILFAGLASSPKLDSGPQVASQGDPAKPAAEAQAAKP